MLQGGVPSFNNLLDLDVAYRIASDYTTPTVVIAKHADPVGIASADELVEAYRRALETDPVASFGAIVRQKQGLELLRVPPDPAEGIRDYGIAKLDFKRVGGGLLVETLDDLR